MELTSTEQGRTAGRGCKGAVQTDWISVSCKGIVVWTVEHYRLWQMDSTEHCQGLRNGSETGLGTVLEKARILCRYIIMRRSALNPIFHPYYIEYGYDKTEFFFRLFAYNRRFCFLSTWRFQVLRSSSRLWNGYPSHSVIESRSSLLVPPIPDNSDVENKPTLWENWFRLRRDLFVSIAVCQFRVMCFFSWYVVVSYVLQMMGLEFQRV